MKLDSGADISLIKVFFANQIGENINKSSKSALQADGIIPLYILGETHLVLSRDKYNLVLDALVGNDLDVEIFAGIPFMTRNDVSIRPAKQQFIIGGWDVVYYGPPYLILP